MNGAHHSGMRRWLSAAVHLPGRDGVIATALLVLPWVLVWALAPHHHLNTTAVIILASLTIPLSALWLTWKTYKATRVGSADGGAGPDVIKAEPGAVVAIDRGTAIGQDAVVANDRGTAIGKIEYKIVYQ
jgi:hypothetical protein